MNYSGYATVGLILLLYGHINGPSTPRKVVEGPSGKVNSEDDNWANFGAKQHLR